MNAKIVLSSAEENSAGLAIAVMSDAYSRETLALKQEVESYVNADPYDPERPKIVAVRAAALAPGRCFLLGSRPVEALEGRCRHVPLIAAATQCSAEKSAPDDRRRGGQA